MNIYLTYAPCHYSKLVKVDLNFTTDIIKFKMTGYCNITDKTYNISNKDIDISEILNKLSTNKQYHKTYYFGDSTTKIIVRDNNLVVGIQNNYGTNINFELLIDNNIRETLILNIKKFNKEMDYLEKNPPKITSGHM